MAFAICAAAAAVPFLVTYRLPMNDLPQHAAQIAFWKHYADSCYGFEGTYFKDWLTPYLLGYGIARLFATVLSVNTALKLTTYLTVIAFPLSLRMIVKRAGVEPWLSLLGFPLAYGFSFYWGFLNFIVAVPIGIVFIAYAYDYALAPTARRGAALTVLALLLLASHALVFAICVAIAIVMVLPAWRPTIPYALVLAVGLLWLMHVRNVETRASAAPLWDLSPARPVLLLSDLFAAAFDPSALAFAIVLILVVVLAGVRLTRDWRKWPPFAAVALFYLFGPFSAVGTAFLYERFAALCGSFALLALEPRPSIVRSGLLRILLLGAVVVWLAIVAGRFRKFSVEARDFDRIVTSMPANDRLMYLDVLRASDALPGTPFVHFGAYYQQRKGGIVGRSFASHFPELIRYRPGMDPGAAPGLAFDPSLFRWDSNDSHFNFFLVRSPADMHDVIFRHATEPVDLKARVGTWWLYAKRNALRASCPPFEPDDSEARAQ